MIVTIYHPKFWLKHGHWGYEHQLCHLHAAGNFSFEVNSIRSETDVVVVHDDLDNTLKIKAYGGCFILVIGEEQSIRETYDLDYLNQFDLVITSRRDIVHANVIRTHYLHPYRIRKTCDELATLSDIEKSKPISAIVSDLTILPSHKARYAFINKLKGHYKNELDWFGGDEDSYITDKWDGLAPYEYSIAIENSKHENYFTEKITDCFLSYTMPLYWGCPNINDFFDDRSFVTLEVEDYISSIARIDECLNADAHKKNLKFIRESRRLVLEKYAFIPALVNILSAQAISKKKQKKIIRPQSYYTQNAVKKIAKRILKR